MTISTRVIDSVHGRPAVGVPVRLERREGNEWQAAATGSTGPDGRVSDWCPPIKADLGVYRLVFDTASYFATLGIAAFYPEVSTVFLVSETDMDYSLPLLIGPHAYTAYRSSP
jgi:5-hydroxyisourate hydrolase